MNECTLGGIESPASTYLFASKFNLEILGRFLRDTAAEVQLIHLAVFVPHRRFVVHHEFTAQWRRLGDCWCSIRLDFATF